MDYKDPITAIYFFAMVLSTSIALLFIRVKYMPRYLNFFYLYPLISLIIFINKTASHLVNNYQKFISIQTTQIINNLSFILHFFILGWIIKTNINIKKKTLDIFFWLSLILITYLILAKDLTIKNGLAYGITNLILIIFCSIYFLHLFKSPPTLTLVSIPAFWIINGIFFGMISTIPINFAGDFFFYYHLNDHIQLLKKIGMLSYTTMHLFFIKAYLCIVRPHKVI